MRAVPGIPRGFSLIELVIVIAIAGVIGAIAVPRLSSVSEGAPAAAYIADLSAIQSAVERYTAEHQGLGPNPLQFALQLTQYSDLYGNLSPTKTTTCFYGPYLRRFPEVIVLPRAADMEAASATSTDLTNGGDGGDVAIKSASNKTTVFLYNPSTGRVRLKVTGTITPAAAQVGG